MSLPELSDLVVWSSGFEVRSADVKCGGSGDRMDLLGEMVKLQELSTSVSEIKSWIRLVSKPGPT